MVCATPKLKKAIGTDTQYSIHALTDEAGSITEGYQYDAYGRQTVFTNSGTDTTWFTNDDTQAMSVASAVGNPYGYTGRRYDAETENWYFRMRYFDGDTGRFMNRDPAGYPDGYNQYTFYSNVNSLDPYGLEDCEVSIYLVYLQGKNWNNQKDTLIQHKPKGSKLVTNEGKKMNADPLIDKIIAAAGECCIRLIEWNGHGGSERVWMGQTNTTKLEKGATDERTLQFAKKLAELGEKKCDESSELRFNQCSCKKTGMGSDLKVLQRHLTVIHQAWGGPVSKPTDTYIWSYFKAFGAYAHKDSWLTCGVPMESPAEGK